MKDIFKNPLFYLSVVLVIAIGFIVFNLAKADSFREPTEAFPGGEVSAPIDESSTAQTKAGNLTIGGSLYPGIISLPNSPEDQTLTPKSYWSQFGGGGVWGQSGNNIYYNSGNVGIGTAEPKRKLDIFDSTDPYNNTPLRISGPLSFNPNNLSSPWGSIKLAFGETGQTTDAGYIKVTANSWFTPGTNMAFGTRSSMNGSYREVLRIKANTVNIDGVLTFSGGTGPFCIFSKVCPTGWADKGLGAYIYDSAGGATCPYTVGGKFSDNWTWCNVRICCNDASSVCGDGICSGGETCHSCLKDCPASESCSSYHNVQECYANCCTWNQHDLECY